MSQAFSSPRRVGIALVAIAASAYFLRAPLADALVLRGDDYLYAGNRAAARERYARALTLSPDSELATDRYAFVELLERTPRSLRSGIRVSSQLLRRHDSATVRADRALCFLALHRYGSAFVDFARAAALSQNAQTFTFAGWSALAAKRPRDAQAMFRRALAIAPRFAPARRAMETLR